jgi:hypothetical protein
LKLKVSKSETAIDQRLETIEDLNKDKDSLNRIIGEFNEVESIAAICIN